jgi:hypothetical protein
LPFTSLGLSILNSNKLLGSLKYVTTITLWIRYTGCYSVAIYLTGPFDHSHSQIHNLVCILMSLTDKSIDSIELHMMRKENTFSFSKPMATEEKMK